MITLSKKIEDYLIKTIYDGFLPKYKELKEAVDDKISSELVVNFSNIKKARISKKPIMLYNKDTAVICYCIDLPVKYLDSYNEDNFLKNRIIELLILYLAKITNNNSKKKFKVLMENVKEYFPNSEIVGDTPKSLEVLSLSEELNNELIDFDKTKLDVYYYSEPEDEKEQKQINKIKYTCPNCNSSFTVRLKPGETEPTFSCICNKCSVECIWELIKPIE